MYTKSIFNNAIILNFIKQFSQIVNSRCWFKLCLHVYIFFYHSNIDLHFYKKKYIGHIVLHILVIAYICSLKSLNPDFWKLIEINLTDLISDRGIKRWSVIGFIYLFIHLFSFIFVFLCVCFKSFLSKALNITLAKLWKHVA